MSSLVSFLVVLSCLVLVHEFGHFIVAKSLGVRVEKFSFGFGPKIFSQKIADTEYIISIIPLGGYVKMAGDEPGEILSGQRWEFLSRNMYERFKIIVAGPILNYILAFFIFSIIFMFGSPTLTTEVGGILKGYPAAKEDILVGDRITAIDGKTVKFWEDMTEIIHRHVIGSMTLSVERGDRTFDMDITPIVRETKDIFGKKVKIALIGIAPSHRIEKIRYGPVTSIYMGSRKLAQLTLITYKAIFYIVTGRLSLKESMTGPIGIFMITGKAAELGIIYIFHLMGVLSASLAIFNMLPLPVLDGGHLIFLTLEKMRGRPLSIKTQEFVTNLGISFLVLLTLFIFYNDIVKFQILQKLSELFIK